MNKQQHRTSPAWINLLLGLWLGYIAIGTAHATATDYMEWKTRQQQHDARLKQQNASTKADHYLAKPALLKKLILWRIIGLWILMLKES